MLNNHKRVTELVFDFERGLLGIVTDGVERLWRTEHGMPEGNRLSEVRVDLVKHRMKCLTTEGDRITCDLPRADGTDLLDGRSVIYLDTKDWRALSDAIYDPGSLPPRRVEAARLLVEMVGAGDVVMPVSTQHLAETMSWPRNALRYRQGLTICRHTQGWQMRHPRAVIVDEVKAGLVHRGSRRTLDAPSVFTLRPDGLRRDVNTDPDRYRAPLEFPPEHNLATESALSLSAHLSALLDAEHVARGNVEGWVDWQQGLTNYLGQHDLPREQADREIDLFLLRDTLPEIAKAAQESGTSLSQLNAWIELGASRDIPRMPSLGLFREALRERHLNPTTRWRGTDLADLAFLCCAIGYGAHATADKSQAPIIARAANRLGRPASIHRNLEELASALT